MKANIHIRELYKKYKDVKALENINLDVEEGELFGVIGPDGAGKTSLFRILATLLLPDSGQVSVCGYNVQENHKEIRTILGYMPGKFSLYQDLSVQENLEFFATVFNTRIEDNMEMIRDIWEQIEPFKNRLAGKLSGGMKQKLALCCALVHQPKLLLLDEPTTGVDAVSRSELWQMLKSLKNKGITIVVATPYMDEANLCDRVALMQNAAILQLDTPAGIVSTFKHDLYAIKAQDRYPLLKALRTYESANSVFLFGQSIHYTDKQPSFSIQKLNEYLKNKGIETLAIEKIKPGIEDCFMVLSQQNNPKP